MKRRRILYIANSSKLGGANRVLTDLVEHLDRARFTAAIAMPGHGALEEWARRIGIRAEIVPASGPSRTSALLRAWRLMRMIRKSGAACIHAIDPMCYREASWAAVATGLPRICHVQFPCAIADLRWLFRARPHVVVGCYRGYIDALIREAPDIAGSFVALPNAVDIGRFAPGAELRKSDWKFGRARSVIIVGHLSDIKGHPTFLRAAARALAAVPDCAFLLLGTETVQPGFRAHLERLARELGIERSVHFLGWRENVHEIVGASDVFVLPSLEEGLPLAMLEAMACGIPVIATPVNGIPEVIQDGINGVLVPVNDPPALARAVVRLLSDGEYARQLGSEGRRTVERAHGLSEFVSRMQAIYDELLSTPPGMSAYRVHSTASSGIGV